MVVGLSLVRAFPSRATPDGPAGGVKGERHTSEYQPSSEYKDTYSVFCLLGVLPDRLLKGGRRSGHQQSRP